MECYHHSSTVENVCQGGLTTVEKFGKAHHSENS